MKRLFFLLTLFCSPAFAEAPPIWIEAGSNIGQATRENDTLLGKRWELRYEHRVLSSGTFRSPLTPINAPPLKQGLLMRAKLFVDDAPFHDVVIAALEPIPFEDKEAWASEHPLALYDPEDTTGPMLRGNKIPYKQLDSFADIEAVTDAVIIIGMGVDFNQEEGLAELLFRKGADGAVIWVPNPKGDIPLVFSPKMESILLSKEATYLFPLAATRISYPKWTLQTKEGDLFLVDPPKMTRKEEWDTMPHDGPSILDIRFVKHRDAKSQGRIIFDRVYVKVFTNVESRWYFKSMIETLTPQKGN